MKKFVTLFTGMLLSISLFAQTYTLQSVSNTKLKINGTYYNCSSTDTTLLDYTGSLGNMSSMTLGGSCSVTESTGEHLLPLQKTAAIDYVRLYYSFNLIDWAYISLNTSGQALIGPTLKRTPYSRYDQSIDLSAYSNGSSGTLYIYFEAVGGSITKTDPATDPTVDPYSATFSKREIASTSASVNGTFYSCKGTAYDTFESADLGQINTLSLNGSVRYSGELTAVSASVYYRMDGGEWTQVILNKKTIIASDPGEKSPIIDPVNDNTTAEMLPFMKTLSTTTSYSRETAADIDISGLTPGQTYDLDVYYTLIGVNDPDVNSGTDDYSASFTKVADITFTDGSGFITSFTKGNVNQAVGRFQLTADVAGASLSAASIKIDGTRTGISNIKLWSSADASFDAGSDTQLGVTIAGDPGEDDAVFNSFSSAITTDGTYYFVTADVAPEATGSVQGILVDNSDLTVINGMFSGTISSEVLSGNEVATSVTLQSFNAVAKRGVVELSWSTASEAENSHFLIYRDGEVLAAVPGHGTCSDPHDYAYTDSEVTPGVHEYLLSDVSLNGAEKKHAPVSVEIESDIDTENGFVLENAYPNPFNPRTVLRLRFTAGCRTEMNIYNSRGERVDRLIEGYVPAGFHEITWDASGMPSGVYIVRMLAGDVMRSQKIVLMK